MIVSDKINIEELLSSATNDESGAIVSFLGVVRNHNLGEEVDYLEYESYEVLANKMIQEIIVQAKEKWVLHKVICQHRVGKVLIGESAVVVITMSSHRDEAYQANRYIIDRVKSEVPIWKKEYFSSGRVWWSDNNNQEIEKK